ncbi:MAG: hypothetical protein KAJ55_00655 [Anaerolineales bacterium]|nr:hypothetical protein [Anaerolineales bacterium]
MALEDTALVLIRQFGEDRQVQLRIPNTAPADPAKPWDVDPTATETVVTAPAVVVPIRRSMVDGNSVRAGDETVLIAALSLGATVPTTADKVFDEGIEKNIISLDRIRPGKTDFLYKLQVRAP